mmetsp:Transcript_15040/g.43437  ORF Transcript_15040/g.43437 Transcript_15040/m.43437 type:complete len:229 (+) Transcript_15040:850-1536(+)
MLLDGGDELQHASVANVVALQVDQLHLPHSYTLQGLRHPLHAHEADTSMAELELVDRGLGCKRLDLLHAHALPGRKHVRGHSEVCLPAAPSNHGVAEGSSPASAVRTNGLAELLPDLQRRLRQAAAHRPAASHLGERDVSLLVHVEALVRDPDVDGTLRVGHVDQLSVEARKDLAQRKVVVAVHVQRLVRCVEAPPCPLQEPAETLQGVLGDVVVGRLWRLLSQVRPA